LLAFFSFSPVAAQETDGFDLDLGRFYLAVIPKILEDGVQTDYSFGIFYTNAMKLAGDLKFRTINGAENDTVWDINDSLLARERQIYEFFFLPVNYHFFRIFGFSLRAGAGLYYEYNILKEEGYFNDSSLSEPAGPDHYNAYSNDYSGHALGPLLDTGLSYRNRFFNAAFSFGLVPVFHLNRKQTWKLLPLMNPVPSYTVESKSFCGPYYYLNLDMMLNLKYVSILASFINEYSKLRFTAAGFNGEDLWADVEEVFDYKATALEISLLINLEKSGLMPQIGYGRIFDEVSGGGNYLLLGARKSWF